MRGHLAIEIRNLKRKIQRAKNGLRGWVPSAALIRCRQCKNTFDYEFPGRGRWKELCPTCTAANARANSRRKAGLPGAKEKRKILSARHYYEVRKKDPERFVVIRRGWRRKIGWLEGEHERAEQAMRDTPFCAICKSTKNLVADHNYATGLFRAILCQKHNQAVGRAEYIPPQEVIDYLKRYGGLIAWGTKCLTMRL